MREQSERVLPVSVEVTELARALSLAVFLCLSVPAVADSAGPALAFVEAVRDGEGGVDGLSLAQGIAVSPDGKHVYVAGTLDDAVASFVRNPATGRLTFVERQRNGVGGVQGLDGAVGVVVSPDGKHVYVASEISDAVAAFSRDASTGKLTFLNATFDGQFGVDGLDGATALAISADGAHLYVDGPEDQAFAVFTRNATTGALGFVQILGPNPSFAAFSLSLSPDGKNLYGACFLVDSVCITTRNPSTGMLTFDVAVYSMDLDGIRSVAVSPDGSHVYAASRFADSVARFIRNPTTGRFGGTTVFWFDGVDGVDGLEGAESVLVTGDGRFVLVAGFEEDAVAVFERDDATGDLRFLEVQRDGIGGVDGLLEPVGLATSPDRKHLYVTGSGDDAVVVFAPEPGVWLLGTAAVLALGFATSRRASVGTPPSEIKP